MVLALILAPVSSETNTGISTETDTGIGTNTGPGIGAFLTESLYKETSVLGPFPSIRLDGKKKFSNDKRVKLAAGSKRVRYFDATKYFF